MAVLSQLPTDTSPTDRPTPDSPAAESSVERVVRAFFVSDLHLGSRYARIEEWLYLLANHEPEHLYLVGDFLDARALHLDPRWSPRYDAVFNRLAELAASGTQIHYTPGNHDDYLRHVDVPACDVHVADEFTHETVDGRRIAVLHGDQFDRVEHRALWLSKFGSVLYSLLLSVDRGMNRCLRAMRCRPRRLSRFLKQSTKRIVQWVSGFEAKVLQHAHHRDCDVIVCGHIHIPSVRRLPGVLYFNLGDWVENTTALVEYADGELELIDLEKRMRSGERWYDGSVASEQQVRLTRGGSLIKDALLTGLRVS